MKFSEYKYQRPIKEEVFKKYQELLNKFVEADSFNKQDVIFQEINKLRNNIITQGTLASIRHSINTKDEFYDKENDFFDEFYPLFSNYENKFEKLLLNTKYLKEFKNKYGEHLFNLFKVQFETFNENIIKDLEEENKLSSKYSKLIASAQIEFQGKIYNLPQMSPFMQDKNRQIRKEAQEKTSKFFLDNEKEFDEIYDNLVKVRTRIAKKLGYSNFVELGYKRMNRTDYNKDDVKIFRDQVYKYIVPAAQKLIKRQEKRLNLDKLYYYDLPLKFLSGNPKPKGNKDELVNKAKKMYHELSKETDEFFNYMVNHELLDLEAKPGKDSGGYCTFIPDYKSPFIFSNFNNTSGDVDVLTHEAGHAFQVFNCRNFEIPEYLWPTYEACEIHSMSMEFFAWPWMDLFFEKDADKYRFNHLAEALLFIPYGVLIDEFQHFVYENPDVTPDERKTKFRELEKKYLPHKDYQENEILEKGAYWFRQGHVFSSPFYYIDYTLAQLCAFQYLIKDRNNHQKAWDNYLNLCKLGGSKSFVQLINEVGLKNPFQDGTMKEIIYNVESILNTFDDTKF